MASNNEYKVQSFTRFDASDVSISSLKVNKNFFLEGSGSLISSDINVDRFIGIQGNYLISQSQTGQISGEEQYSVLVYNSIKKLYYTNYLLGSGGEISYAHTASFNPDGTITPFSGSDPKYQTNYYNYEETTLNPQKTFNTESIGVISIPNKLYGDSIEPGTFQIESPASGTLYDDGNGRLYSTGESGTGSFYVGNIIYEHGIITITNQPSEEIL
jgi:hypothetical protein